MTKKRMFCIALLGSACMLITSVMAQSGENQKTITQKERHEKDFSKLKTDLSLSDDQVIAWKHLDEQYKPKMQELKTNTSLTEEEKKSQMIQLRTTKSAELKKILSESQYTKLKSMHRKNHGQRTKDYSKLKTDLSLTDDQVTAWKKLDEQYKVKATALRNNSTIKEEEKKKQMKELHAAKRSELKKILKEEQYTQYKNSCKNRKCKKPATK